MGLLIGLFVFAVIAVFKPAIALKLLIAGVLAVGLAYALIFTG
jgi:hypothetical protein